MKYSYLQVGTSGPRVVHGIILEIVISLEYLNQAILVNYFGNCLANTLQLSWNVQDSPGILDFVLCPGCTYHLSWKCGPDCYGHVYVLVAGSVSWSHHSCLSLVPIGIFGYGCSF